MGASAAAWPRLFALLVSASLLAGCASAKAKAVDPDPYLQPKGFTEETGAVEGVVVDDEFQPLKDAIVGFIDPYQATKTDEFGHYEIGMLKPGPRNLYVIHLGHKSAGKRIEIKPNEPTNVQFVLPPLPVEEPWIDIVRKVGRFDRAARIDMPVYNPSPVNSTEYSWRLKDDYKVLNGLHMDVVWQQGSSLAGGLRVSLGFGGSDSKVTFFTVDGRSPLGGQVDRAKIDEAFAAATKVCTKEPCKLRWYATPTTKTTNQAVDLGIMMDQNFEVYVAHAYRLTLPADYTTLA